MLKRNIFLIKKVIKYSNIESLRVYCLCREAVFVALFDDFMYKGDVSMKTAGEIIHHLNETGANVYDVSKQFGLADTTLRARLIKLGYEVNQEGKWKYVGDSGVEPADEDVVSKKRLPTTKRSNPSPQVEAISSKSTIHQALMGLDLTKEGVRTTITTQSECLEEMKALATKTRLRISDLYTLAIQEFLDKYRSGE